MKTLTIGLVTALMCLANSAFAAEPQVTSLAGMLTSGQIPAKTQIMVSPGKLSLNLAPREAVKVPAPFDVSMTGFTFCVEAEPDAPEVFLVENEFLRIGSTKMAPCQSSTTSNFKFSNIQPGKIVTLLLAPE